MMDWSSDLSTALASGDPGFMKAMLARVPRDVLQRAIPYLTELARISEQDGKLEEALTYYGQLIETAPATADWHVHRARVYFKLDQLEDALRDAQRITELLPEQALGYGLQAQALDGLRQRPQAVAAYRQVLRFVPDDASAKQRIQFLETEIRREGLLRQALDPQAAAEPLAIELPPPPQVTFDPVLFDDPSIPGSFEKFRVEGLRQHLWRHSGHQSAKNSLARLVDPVWLAAWDTVLSTMKGSKVLLRGSELGVFAVRALQYGARRVLGMELFSLDARIADGIVHKHLVTAWHEQHSAAIQAWSDVERRGSFESFAKDKGIDITVPDSEQLLDAQCDHFVFPNIDHSLLGTGIVKAIRQYQAGKPANRARILPAKASVFAMGIQWSYPSTAFELQPVNQLRWSLYPQALELAAQSWTALTAPTKVGEVDFESFAETLWQVQLPILADGNVDAIVFWFDLDLGNTRVSNAPGSDLRCIKPAVQHLDCISVERGRSLPVRVQVRETRLYFQAQPAPTQLRSHGLPNWYVPMLLDQHRNDVFGAAIGRAVASNPAQLVLDIGAGCGLLSMLAAANGAERVVGCEVHPAISRIGKDVIKRNLFEHKVTLINKDCRSMKVPDDLPRRADLAIFELFDCSLIGEGVLHFLAYAREHLLTPNARYLPAAAKVRAMVIEYRVNRVWDIDVNLLNPYLFTPSFTNVDAGRLAFRTLTEPFDLFAFDFSKATPVAEVKELQIPATAAGMAGAVLFWFELQLDEASWISNDPRTENSLHWKQGLQFLPEVRVETAMQLPLLAKHNGSSLILQWQQDVLPAEALLQHCMQNADEYAKVAELAKRFAIDPAAHGLDPIIAQRFAATVLGASA